MRADYAGKISLPQKETVEVRLGDIDGREEVVIVEGLIWQ